MRRKATLSPSWTVLGLFFLLLPAATAAVLVVPAATPRQDDPPRYKGIFEPISYPDDVKLFSIDFVDEQTGWAAGGRSEMQGGVILHTNDGGDSWRIQFGDLDSSERGFKFIRFLDEKHGWVQQGNDRLLRTTDGGETWEELGRAPVLSYQGIWVFVSPSVGFGASQSEILRTQDGGRTWNPVYACQERVQVDGLTRNVACQVQAIHFPTPEVGYAVGYAAQPSALWVLKSTDGGAAWGLSHLIPDASGRDGAIFFTSERNGVAREWQGRLFVTDDGGTGWRAVAGASVQGRPPLHFADANVGWTIGYRKLVFTVDGGRRWTSRDLPFPVHVNDFALPRSNRGYVVGDHGMIYRYKVVPVEYSVPGGIDAPAMPAPPQ